MKYTLENSVNQRCWQAMHSWSTYLCPPLCSSSFHWQHKVFICDSEIQASLWPFAYNFHSNWIYCKEVSLFVTLCDNGHLTFRACVQTLNVTRSPDKSPDKSRLTDFILTITLKVNFFCGYPFKLFRNLWTFYWNRIVIAYTEMEIDIIKQTHVFSSYKSLFVRPGHK